MEWNHKTISVENVSDWIKGKVKYAGTLSLVEVYRSNDWAITAKFNLEAVDKHIVVKIGFLPIFKPSPSIYTFLINAAPDYVPSLIGYDVFENETWMLFEEFKGEIVRDINTIESIKETAVTLATIQREVSKELEECSSHIPAIPLNIIPALYKDLLRDIKSKYIKEWMKNKEKIQADFNINSTILNKLLDISYFESIEETILDWSKRLEGYSIPHSIYHIDLHTANAVKKQSGNVLIFDWEEGAITHPFFSLEKLLNDARSLEDKGDPVNKYSRFEQEVKDAYLSSFSPDSSQQLSEAFDIARCLAPIVYIYQSQFFLQQVGWEKEAPGLIANDLAAAISWWEKF